MSAAEILILHELKELDRKYMKELKRLLINAKNSDCREAKRHRGDTKPVIIAIRERLKSIYPFIK